MSVRPAKKIINFILIIFFPLLLLPIIMALILIVPSFLDQKIFPRTTVGAISIGYLTLDQAQTKIESSLSEFLKRPFLMHVGADDHIVNLAELGLTIDYKDSLKSAPIMKQNQLKFLTGNFFKAKNIKLKPQINWGVLSEFLQTKNPNLKPAINASFYFDADKTLKISSEQAGQTFNRSELLAAVTDNLNNLRPQPITITYRPTPPRLTVEDLTKLQPALEKQLKTETKLSFNDKTWPIILWDHPAWVQFQPYLVFDWPQAGQSWPVDLSIVRHNLVEPATALPLKKSIKISLVKAPVEEFITTTISPAVKIDSQNISIKMGSNGQVIFEGKGINGRDVDREKLADYIATAVANNIRNLPIPIKYFKSKVTTDDQLKSLGINELIGTGYTDFSGSPQNRIHNIGIGLNRLNGILVPPGQTLSFLNSIGEISGQTGYKKELVIKEGQTIPDYGGGICQVSSTMYRAILYSGLPVVQRQPHTYAVNYYFRPSGPGLDATIFQPAPDLKFINDTPAHILIQGYQEGTSAYFKFYGTNDGRQVIMDGPYTANHKSAPPDQITYTDQLPPGEKKQVDKAHAGFDATWYRTIIKNGQEIKETIFSRYRAWPAKIMVGQEKKADAEVSPI